MLGLGHLEGRGGRPGVTVELFALDWRSVADRGVQPVGVESADPGGGLPLDLGAACPGPLAVDQARS
jgi:hypothetical protein